MPQVTIQIDERQEALILEALRAGKDFYISGGSCRVFDNLGERVVEFSKIQFNMAGAALLEGHHSARRLFPEAAR